MNRSLSYLWSGGALWIARGRNVWKVSGPDAGRLYACARAVEARGLSPGRVLGRLLQRRYGVTIERQARESADQERRRELEQTKGEPEDLAAQLAASLRTAPGSRAWYPALPGGPEGRDLDRVGGSEGIPDVREP